MSEHPFSISLVTYTYNDHELAADLLRYSTGFRIPINEYLVVDDASAEPFRLPAYAAEDAVLKHTRILRLEKNVGPGQAKRHGLNAVTGDVVFSLDADIRPHAEWLRHALQFIADPQIGLVGAICAPAMGSSALAKARHRLCRPERRVSNALILAGACMLYRREVWTRLGGLEDYSPTAYEDYHFCRKLHAAGYRLLQCDTFPVYETRHLHRTSLCRRQAGYLLVSCLGVVKKRGFRGYLQDSEKRLRECLAYAGEKDPVLCYAFFLETVHLGVLLARKLREEGIEGDITPDGVLRGGLFLVDAHPTLRTLLLRDLQNMGHEDLQRTPEFRPVLADFFEPFSRQGIWEMLENTFAARYMEEDSTLKFDGHYMR